MAGGVVGFSIFKMEIILPHLACLFTVNELSMLAAAVAATALSLSVHYKISIF
jgi:hypothetical protein